MTIFTSTWKLNRIELYAIDPENQERPGFCLVTSTDEGEIRMSFRDQEILDEFLDKVAEDYNKLLDQGLLQGVASKQEGT